MEKEPHRMAGLYTLDRAAAIEQAAEEYNLDFRIVAKKGQGYTLTDGGKIQFFIGPMDPVVPEDMVVGSLPTEADLTEGFWDRVSEIQNNSNTIVESSGPL